MVGWRQRFTTATFDYAVQALVGALMAAIAAGAWAVWAYFAGIRGPWLDRALGAAIGVIAVLVVTGILVLFRLRSTRIRLAQTTPSPTKKGFLDYLLAQRKVMRDFTTTLTVITRETQEIRTLFETSTKQLQDVLRQRSEHTSAVRKVHRIATHTAKALDRRAARMKVRQESLQRISAAFIENFFGYFEWLVEEPQADRPQLEQNRETLVHFRDAVDRALRGTTEWRESLVTSRHATGTLHDAANRLAAVLDGIINIESDLQKTSTVMLERLNEKLATTPS